jgi:hypothetical protein
MWKRFPEVLGLDNTYKTNRFKMYLFQVTGVTDQRSLANFAFGLINTEKEEGFQWMCSQLDRIRREIVVPTPAVVITDKEAALRNALAATFPLAQQQLCIYHINANVRSKIISRWKDPDEDDEDSSIPSTENPILNTPFDDNIQTRQQAQDEAESGIFHPSQLHRSFEPDEYNREGMFCAWKRVIFAADEDAFEKAWLNMKTTYSKDQIHILKYISDEYMPWRQQWAKCYIDRYRNYGQRVNSPCETAHKDVKSYLINGQSDLLHLHIALEQMIEKKERDYKQQAAEMQMRQRRKYLTQTWLGDITMYVTFPAIELIAQQHRLAAAAIEAPRREAIPLRPCRKQFRHQYGLPCSHEILQRLHQKVPLSKYDVHTRWWLDKPLVFHIVFWPRNLANFISRISLSHSSKSAIPMSLKTAVAAHAFKPAIHGSMCPWPYKQPQAM